MYAILTKFRGPTDHRCARIQVQCGPKRMDVPYTYTSSSNLDEHHKAVLAFLDGHYPDVPRENITTAERYGGGYVFVVNGYVFLLPKHAR
jgi:hypothetical protein